MMAEKIFDKYKAMGINLSESGETADVIKGQGLLKYGQDLGMEDDKDPLLLLIAWKFNTIEKVSEYPRNLFVDGWKKEGCDSFDSMKKKIKQWREELKKKQIKSISRSFIILYLIT